MIAKQHDMTYTGHVSVKLNRKPRSQYTHYNLNFDKGAKDTYWRKRSFFNNWCWQTYISHMEKNEIRSLFLARYENNPEDMKDLNVRNKN